MGHRLRWRTLFESEVQIRLMEKLLNALRKAPIDDFKINAKHTDSRELYYVLDRLETVRTTETDNVNVTIYVDEGGQRGSSEFSYYSYMDEEEIAKIIEEKVYAAKFALNPAYEIPAKTDEKPAELHSNFGSLPLTEVAEEVAKTIFEAGKSEGGFLSATEIFIYKTTRRVINSRGVDLSEVSYSGFVEVIPSYGEDDDEVETYNSFCFASLDKEFIRNKIKEAVALTKARFEAVPLKLDKPVKVILEGEGVLGTISFFIEDLDYRAEYLRMSRFELGKPMQGDNVEGDLVSVDLLTEYPGIAGAEGFDGDGVILRPATIMKDGVAVSRFGSFRFGRYLGVERPTGNLPIYSIAPGSKSEKEMKSEPYLRCVKYSSFQAERNSGYFGGEVRLGFYFDGEKEIPVTGFSIAGSLLDLSGKLILSKERVAESFAEVGAGGGYVAPKCIEVKGMNIV